MATRALDHADRLLDAGQRNEAVALVQAEAERGDGDAMQRLAIWQLVGDPLPRDLSAARKWLRQAVEAGHEDAALIEVALTASGAGAAPDWALARRRLDAAAARWGGTAQAHADLLARMDIDRHGMPRRVPAPETLGQSPHVRRWRGLLSQEECAHLATSALDLLAPSMVVDPHSGRQIAHPVRRSSAAVVGPTRETLPIQAIQRRLAAITDTDVRQGEPFAILHYKPGQEYLPHLDTLPHERNQRAMTVLLYLNEGYAGGETHFAASNLTVAGGLGDAVAFSNLRPDGTADFASRHAGLPVQAGIKWMATRWIRRDPLNVWAISS